MPRPPARDWIALVLAIGLACALNTLTLGVLYDALVNDPSIGLTENATQVLTGWGGGIVGILGAVFGYRAGAQQHPEQRSPSSYEDDGERDERP